MMIAILEVCSNATLSVERKSERQKSVDRKFLTSTMIIIFIIYKMTTESVLKIARNEKI